MTTLGDLPVEVLTKILHIATHFDDPSRLENPVINWHSKTTLFFQRDFALTKVFIVRLSILLFICASNRVNTGNQSVDHPRLPPLEYSHGVLAR